MPAARFTPEQIAARAQFSADDLAEIHKRRRDNNRLGFGYHLAFVRLANRFPAQQPLEVVDDLLSFVSIQLNIDAAVIATYEQRQQTMAEHRAALLDYLQLRRFEAEETSQLEAHLFSEACRLEQTGPLLVKAKHFLQENGILFPADGALRRLIGAQRRLAREYIYGRIATSLSDELREKLDELLLAGGNRLTPFQSLKQPPRQPSPKSMLRLGEKLDMIQTTTVLDVEFSWLNNNYQRSLAHYAQRCSADRLRALTEERRYAVLTCFLRQLYQDTIDHMVDMHDKLMLKVENRAQEEMDAEMRRQRRLIRHSLHSFHRLGQIQLDDSIHDTDLRGVLFQEVDKEQLVSQLSATESWLTGKYGHVFNLVVQRFYYLRQFSPILLEHLAFRHDEGAGKPLVQAIQLLQEMNGEGKRKLPDEVPLGFVSRNLRSFIEQGGEVNKHAWECALLLAIRDEVGVFGATERKPTFRTRMMSSNG